MTIQPAPSTFQERFARACDVVTFALDKDGPCYLLWEVEHVQAGQRVSLMARSSLRRRRVYLLTCCAAPCARSSLHDELCAQLES